MLFQMTSIDPATAYRLAECLLCPILGNQHTDELIADSAFGDTAAFARFLHLAGSFLGVSEIRFIHLDNAVTAKIKLTRNTK